jgi:GNAT superfamily N-acetyltransferase
MIAMFRRFIENSQYRSLLSDSPLAVEAMLTGMLNTDAAAIFVADQEGATVGMLGVIDYPHAMSGEHFAAEVFWWLDPGHRGSGGWLLRRAEKWARARGATRMQMMSPFDNPRVGTMYQAVGYAPVEVIYQKDLQ